MSSRADERIKRSVLFAFVAVNTLHSGRGERSFDRKYVCVRRLGTVSNKLFCIFCFPFFRLFLLTDVS